MRTDPALSELDAKLGPVQVVRLRGGVHGDDDWVIYPEKVSILISTIDQIGSRFLHRGYGVSTRMAPLHAGFVGNNALYIIDEAHLSLPFLETIQTACRYGADIRLIAMTATPPPEFGKALELTEEDRKHPLLKRRLKAKKLATLIECSDNEKEFVKQAVSAALELAETGKVVGIVVNRVNTARRIREALARGKHRAELLTGRIRPYDRDRLLDRILPEIRVGRTRENDGKLFIVATQTIEVGADLDFDALVTEAATLDALRQRFGRLDRLGTIGSTRAIILYRPRHDKKTKEVIPDPIYGTTMHDVWKWLQKKSGKKGGIDFGITAMEKTMKEESAPVAQTKHAPVLLPSHISLFSQTGPEAPYVDVSPWLHGPQSASADVSIIWRADLDPDQPDSWSEIVRLCPPFNREALEIPVYSIRPWLEGRHEQEVTDLEGIGSFSAQEGLPGRRVLCWRGPDDYRVVNPSDIRPGDTVVVPAEYGGCDQYGWAPQSEEPAEDISDFCSLERPRDHVVRLVSGLTGWLGEASEKVLEAVNEIIDAESASDPEMGVDEDRVQAAHINLRGLLEGIDHPLIASFQNRYEIEKHPHGVILRGSILDEVEATLYSGVAVELDRHLQGVAGLAKELAHDHSMKEGIVRAARKHDTGKAEPRFQAMLYGNMISAAAGPLLAKSGLRKRSQVIAAFAQSGLPRGFRHELASLCSLHPGGVPEINDLVPYLIGTHHGYGRPWFPVCADPETPGSDNARIGSGWASVFAGLLDLYGPWRLAEMELLLRASDARQSKAEQEESSG